MGHTTTFCWANCMFRLRNKKCSESGPNRRCSGPKQYQKRFWYYPYKTNVVRTPFNLESIAGILIICPMRQQHWTDHKISLCVCQSVSQSVIQNENPPPHISGTVKARNFKFGTHTGHCGS